MTTSQIIFSIYIYAMIAVYFITLPKIFTKAGEESWKGYVPGYNLFVWLKILKQPWWWMFFFIPYFTMNSIGMLTEGVAFLMMIVLNVSTARIFKKFSWQDTLKMILLPHWGMVELAFDKSTYFGRTDWHDKEQEEERKISDHIGLFFSLPVIGHALVFILQLAGQKKKKTGKSLVKEWNDAILFAVVAASIIRSMVFEPFTIPTPSMEKDLLVGDYLFVSKMSYGPKLPNTPLSIPFFHNYIPVVGRNSYVEWAKRPYRRLPGVGSVERNEVVVFNFPAGDTAIFDPGVQGLMGHTYKNYLTDIAVYEWAMANKDGVQNNTILSKKSPLDFEAERTKYEAVARQKLIDMYGLVNRPVDKRENYIKRCVAIAGDEIQIKDNQLFVNGKASEYFEDMQYNYYITFAAGPEDRRVFGSMSGPQIQGYYQSKFGERFKENYDITPSHIGLVEPIGHQQANGQFVLDSVVLSIPLTKQNKPKFEQMFGKANVKVKNLSKKPGIAFDGTHYQYQMIQNERLRGQLISNYHHIYPNHPKFDWTEDNFGPLVIPAEGMKIELTEDNWIKYKRVIEVYEGNKIAEKDGKYLINGKEASDYTFQMDYYWMMGDNRHNSADSRFWGFVPEDHVVGKAVFIWMSKDPDKGFFSGGIRWNRVFTAID